MDDQIDDQNRKKKSIDLINFRLDKIYKDPKSGAAYSSLNDLYKVGKQHIPSLKKIRR